MRPPRSDRPRPAPPGDRRALTHAGGDVEREGPRALTDLLAHAARPPADADPRVLTHGFHAWPARMHPHTAGALIGALRGEGAVLDPFMGGGTVPVEAMLAGRPCYGRDINPVALEVAWARTRLWGRARLDALEAAARRAVERARDLREETPVPDAVREAEGAWYDPPALAEVWSLAQALRDEPDRGLRRMLRAALSSLLVKASRQVSDSVPRRDVEHKWVPRGRVEQWLLARVAEHRRGLAELSAAVPRGTQTPRLALKDARELDARLRGKVAGVLTSPPYPGVYDYVEHHRRRYAMLELEVGEASRAEMGARRHQREKGWMSAAWRFQEDLGRAMAAWRAILRRGAPVWLVIGDGEHAEGVVKVLPLVERAAAAAGLALVARVSQARPVLGPASRRTDEPRLEHVIALELPP